MIPPLASRAAQLPLVARRAFGELLPVLDDPELSDVLVHVADGAGQLWLRRGGVSQRVPNWQVPAEAVRALAVALIAAGGRHLDELHPFADVHLGSGIRVHAVLPPVAAHGPAVSIRVPRLTPLSFAHLLAGGLCSEPIADRLVADVAERRNMLITGSTGTGKTTVLAALLDLAPPGDRIVTIEDVAELRLEHPHRVALETRQATAEGVGAVGLEQLLREALRMRPDRLVLGECRGAEVVTLFSALNTGHDGGAGTLHASRLHDVPARLEALGALAGLGAEALARQAVSAVHTVVHLTVTARQHRVAAVGRFELTDRGRLGVVTELRA